LFNSKHFLDHTTERPGVYCMRNSAGVVLYVGKAKNLKKRLASYFNKKLDDRLSHLVANIAHIDVTITASEKEALLLENSLIKSLSPKYNIIFKDDKFYPYLLLTQQNDFPRLIYHRGAKNTEGRYFGPYPSALSVKVVLDLIQKIFKLRQCSDAFFNTRLRPCLQYQIKRCTAPCVGYISKEQYDLDVQGAKGFLLGERVDIVKKLIFQMNEAADHQDFELAAKLRDKISHIRQVQEKQHIYVGHHNVDVIALLVKQYQACVQVLFIRAGVVLDSKSYFVSLSKNQVELTTSQILQQYIFQHYIESEIKQGNVSELVVSEPVADQELLEEVLQEKWGKKVSIVSSSRGIKNNWLIMAKTNAEEALIKKLSAANLYQKRLEALIDFLKVESLTQFECVDVSHHAGEATVVSCVVFDKNGPLKSQYRLYNIENGNADDYGALRTALTRRFEKLKLSNPDAISNPFSDILFIDGGKGQLNIAIEVLESLQIIGIKLIGVAKGAGRKPGLETLYILNEKNDKVEIQEAHLPPHSPALHLIQQIRDEAHRFAIQRQRKTLGKKRKQSTLEAIPGVGPKKRMAILTYFGGLQELMRASEEAIAGVSGIGPVLAKIIYAALHQK
jgi:excinuclease ABC subunit C